MKKVLILLILIPLFSGVLKAQQLPPYDRTRQNQVLDDRATWSRYFLGVPHGTTPAFPAYVPDSVKCGAAYYRTTDSSLYIYNCEARVWERNKTSITYAQAKHYTDSLIAVKTGAANGIASLDGGGKVPFSELPANILIYQGQWNPGTNTPTLADGVGTSGWVYQASADGDINLGSGALHFLQGDFVIYNGTRWQLSAGTDRVTSVNNKQGIVNLSTTDIPQGTNLYYTDGRVAAYGDISYLRLGGTNQTVAQTPTFSNGANLNGHIVGTNWEINPISQDFFHMGNGTIGVDFENNQGTNSVSMVMNSHDATHPLMGLLYSPTYTGDNGLYEMLDNAGANIKRILTTDAFGTSNTWTVPQTMPVIYGGSGVISSITLQGTTGNGTLTASAININVGNNGAKNAITVLNNGNTGIGVAAPSAALHVLSAIRIADPNSTSNGSEIKQNGAVLEIRAGSSSGGTLSLITGGAAYGSDNTIVQLQTNMFGGTTNSGFVYTGDRIFAFRGPQGISISGGNTTPTIFANNSMQVGLAGTTAPTHTLTFASASTGIAEYNTSSQVTNYERLLSSWISNVYTIQTQSAGTGVARSISVNGVTFSNAGNVTGTSFIKSGGTGSNLLVDDGTGIAETTFATATQYSSNYAAIGFKQPRSLSNYVLGTSAAITSADSVVGAFGKIQAQINTNNTNIAANTTAVGLRKLISDSTASTGYQTVGNFFPKGDKRYVKLSSGSLQTISSDVTVTGVFKSGNNGQFGGDAANNITYIGGVNGSSVPFVDLTFNYNSKAVNFGNAGNALTDAQNNDDFLLGSAQNINISNGGGTQAGVYAQFNATNKSLILNGGGTFTSNASAILQLNSTAQGFLPPSMTTTQKNAIATPATGLTVFDNSLGKLNIYNGTGWETLNSAIGGSGTIVASGNLTAQTTTANLCTYTPSANTTFLVNGYINSTTSFTSGSVSLVVSFTDEFNNPWNLSLTSLSGPSYVNGSPVTVRAKGGTLVTLRTSGTFVGTFDTGGTITQQ